MIQLKRAYEQPSPQDGYRVLVERFWPRDLDEKHSKVDLWLRDVAPSEKLHQEFGESPDPSRWADFERSYRSELQNKHKSIKQLTKKHEQGLVTLLHAAHNPDHCGAIILKRFLEESARSGGET
jgi:uncharacterized protein YeaO (DUF488 family)